MNTNEGHQTGRTQSRIGPSFRALLLGALWVAGCGGRGGDESEPPAPTLQQAGAEASGATFADVRANGTGCPPGTASTSISSDGLVFTTTFSNYVTQVDPSTDVTVRDCQLEIKLSTPTTRSYSVQTFSYAGFALLQEGVTGRQTANYYFQGTPVAPTESNRTELVGPYERAYVFTDDVSTDERVWSPCGVERNLNVVTRVQLFNSTPRRAGYMNLTSVDGSSKVVLKLDARGCDAPQAPVPGPGSALEKVTGVTVVPSTFLRSDPFSVSWTASSANLGAAYRVQVRAEANDTLVWESGETASASLRYSGGTLPAVGFYRVRVIARRGTQETISEPVRIYAIDSPTAGKPTQVQVTPRPIVRGRPFTVSWRPSATASASSYRVTIFPEGGLEPAAVVSRSGNETTATFPADALPRAGTYVVQVSASVGGSAVPSDALSVEAVDGAPAQASPLLGRYAARAHGFWSNGRTGSMMSVKELSLTEFVQVGDALEMRTQLCSQESTSLGFLVNLVAPETYPEIRRKVTLERGGFRTDALPFATGYAREGVAACEGRAGQYVPKQPDQTWIRGSTCRCPYSAASVPTFDDCRVSDPDGDGQPALAYAGGGPLPWTSHLATVNRSFLVGGVIRPDGRHRANVRYDEMSYQLACEGRLCSDNAAAPQPCTSDVNGIQFVPLPPPPAGQTAWTCATLRASAQRLFPQPPPSAPSSCTRATLTDPSGR